MSANPPERHLPGHIQAALNTADSAGQPWEGRDLSGPGNPLHNFENDGGEAPTALIDALARLTEGTGGEAGVIAALAHVRVFVPVLATTGDSAEEVSEHGDKHADMALITIAAPDGRAALPIFSDVASLESWHPEPRPVAVYAPRAALAAVQEKAQLLVLNPGSEYTFVVRRPAMWALAQQREWKPSYDDPRIVDTVEKVTGGIKGIIAVVLHPGSGIGSRTAAGTLVAGGGVGPELRMALTVDPAADPHATVTALQEALRRDEAFATMVDSLEMTVHPLEEQPR